MDEQVAKLLCLRICLCASVDMNVWESVVKLTLDLVRWSILSDEMHLTKLCNLKEEWGHY